MGCPARFPIRELQMRSHGMPPLHPDKRAGDPLSRHETEETPETSESGARDASGAQEGDSSSSHHKPEQSGNVETLTLEVAKLRQKETASHVITKSRAASETCETRELEERDSD